MLSPKPQLNLAHAREYFREHLSVGDYYAEGQQVAGQWFGEAAEKLGLKGKVGEKEFLALCEGMNPVTGEKLTQRKNYKRQEAGKTVANRRVFYDFTISPPKSVSVVALMQDARILQIHDEAVKRAMVELEQFAGTRVRKSGANRERVTGNVLGAAFRHDTSRELDPLVHTHCVVFNATFDPVENRWKALDASGMYRAQRFANDYYFHELAKGLRGLGYEIASHGPSFEIKGVPASVIEQFSKRHRQIDEETQKRIEREGLRGNVKDVREQVARDERKRKIKDSTASNLRPQWVKQLSAADKAALDALWIAKPHVPVKADIAGIVVWADEYLFERRSVVNDYELMAAALAHGRGQDFDLAALREAIEKRGYIREEGTHKLTSPEMLDCEYDIVVAAKDGRCREWPINPDFLPSDALSTEQAAAVRHILGSRDFITLFRGGAGTGKSFTLREVTKGIQAAGLPVVVLAPQRQQVTALHADGMVADTLASRLQTKSLPRQSVVLLDEAGQVGGRQLAELITLVKVSGGRLILSGDTRQHGAVQASDALRVIEKYSGLRAAVLRDIRRQNPAHAKSNKEREFVSGYREAVHAAAYGHIGESFNRLDRLGCIREAAPDNRRELLAREYLASLDRKESALVVAQTWAEVNAVNDAIREELQANGKIGSSVLLKTYQAIDLSEAQKRDARSYQPSQFVHFVQRYGRYQKGEICAVVGANEHGLTLVKDGRRSTVSYRYANRLAVVTEREMDIAPGDRLQLKFNAKSKESHALTNGELVTVREMRKDGSLVVVDDAGKRKTLSPSQRLFNRGYAVTSYASQGKTVDTVLIADAGCALATNRNQWYVAISRGRKRVVVFTDDKTALRAAIEQSGDRGLALEMKPTTASPSIRLFAWNHERSRRAWESIERSRRERGLIQKSIRQKAKLSISI